MILGLGGKMGPSLGKLLINGLDKGGISKKIYGVSRFSDQSKRADVESCGIQTIAGDLLDESFLQQLPDVENVIFMAGQKFGTVDNEAYTWAMNTYLPGRVADRFSNSRIVAFSTGNVYPFTDVKSRGASESMTTQPLGEYAQSCLGRERIFEHFSKVNNTPTLIFRLNYALDLKYGVLNDIARLIWNQQSIDLSTGYVNVIWQGDANEYAIRSLLHCTAPATHLNVTGPEVLPIRSLAIKLGEHLNKTPQFIGEPKPTALLSDASLSFELFGKPLVSIDQMISWTAEWIRSDGAQINKPTHFQERKGNF